MSFIFNRVNNMQFILDNGLMLSIGFVVGALLSYLFFILCSPKARKLRQLNKDLADTTAELERQQQELTKHFADSAELLDKMAQDFRQLYQHMASKSTTLLANNAVATSENSAEVKQLEETSSLASDNINKVENIEEVAVSSNPQTSAEVDTVPAHNEPIVTPVEEI